MGCTQSMPNLNTISEDETDCRDDCAPLPSHCESSEVGKWSTRGMLCHHSSGRPPTMPRPSVRCSAIDNEEDTDVVRRWIPLDEQEQQGLEVHHSVHQQHLILSQSSEQDPNEMKERQSEIISRYDLNTLHMPLLEPFLGSMYWTAATPLPNRTFKRQASSPSRLTCSSSVCTSPVINTVEIAQVTPISPEIGLKDKHHPINTSFDRTEELSRTEDDINLSLNSINVNIGQGPKNVDVSRELLDYSVLDEDIDVLGVPQTPRRLFEEEEMVTPSRLIDNSILEADGEEDSNLVHATNNDEIETIPSRALFVSGYSREPSPRLKQQQHMATGGLNISPTVSESNMEVCRINYPPAPAYGPITPPKPLPPSPNIATFYGNWGSCRERHVSTLPSQITGKPIKLRITETRPIDSFSYDPYYSSGTYVITTENKRPYGNGLLMRMGTQFMTLEDGRGCTLAVIKSRYTHVPSSVVYSPKPRFSGQAPSGHRLSNQISNGNSAEFYNSSSELYPWALVRKEGRTMKDACTVHLVDESTAVRGNKTRHNSLFTTLPNFRGCHNFEGEWNTHTLVTRTLTLGKNGGSKEVQCCVIVRDPTDVDEVDITIAPGIDPLLMICYLAAHSKMDVEPIMGGF